MRTLIVNADDYGLTRGVSAGIRRAHAEGIVTSTTAMANMPGAADDLGRLKGDCPNLGLGVHLVLSAGRPLRPAAKVPSLIDERTGAFPKVDAWPDRFRRVAVRELRDEWRAQIDLVAAAGGDPGHLDSHHHLGYLHPRLLEAMLELAQDYRLAVRCPLALPGDPAVLGEGEPGAASPWAETGAAGSGVPYPQGLATGFFGDGATFARLQAILAALPEDGAAELMCHPGEVDADLKAISSYHDRRGEELAILTDAGLSAMVESQGVFLASFAGLIDT